MVRINHAFQRLGMNIGPSSGQWDDGGNCWGTSWKRDMGGRQSPVLRRLFLRLEFLRASCRPSWGWALSRMTGQRTPWATVSNIPSLPFLWTSAMRYILNSLAVNDNLSWVFFFLFLADKNIIVDIYSPSFNTVFVLIAWHVSCIALSLFCIVVLRCYLTFSVFILSLKSSPALPAHIDVLRILIELPNSSQTCHPFIPEIFIECYVPNSG